MTYPFWPRIVDPFLVNTPAEIPDIDALLGLFYAAPEEFGVWARVEGTDVPEPYRRLLDHEGHMTETMEAFHGSGVDVEVLDWRRDGSYYSRKIVLRRKSDRRVTQFGIVRLNFDCVSPDVQAEIESRRQPLGRVLIDHNVLRSVRLARLWKIEPGNDLRRLFGLAEAHVTYGRTALIFTGSEPAVELLEVAAPTGEAKRIAKH